MTRPRIPMTEETKRRLALELQEENAINVHHHHHRADKKGSDDASLASILLDQLRVRGQIVSDSVDIYQYDTCINTWNKQDKVEILNEISKFSMETIDEKKVRISDPKRKSIYNIAVDAVYKKDFFRESPRGVNLKNGFLALRDGIPELIPWDPDQRSTSLLDVAYNPEADTTMWYRLLYTIFDAPSSQDDAKNRADFLGEFVGACLFGYATDYAKCAILLGDGSNGKSTFMEIISKFFPANSVTSIDMQDWSRPYYAIHLKDKKINIVEELSSKVMKDSSIFKSVITGELIKARNPYEKMQTFEPRCGHIVACNTLPYNFDFSHGFTRRCVIVPFDHVFKSGKTKAQVVDSMRSEYPGILRWAVEGAQRLIAQGGYTVPSSSASSITEWELESNSIAQWFDLYCTGNYARFVPSFDDWVSSTVLYTHYSVWAKQHGLPTLSHNLFGRYLKKMKIVKKRKENGRFYGFKTPQWNAPGIP